MFFVLQLLSNGTLLLLVRNASGTAADDVVCSVLDLFVEAEWDGAWHGGCLALAELARYVCSQQNPIAKLQRDHLTSAP